MVLRLGRVMQPEAQVEHHTVLQLRWRTAAQMKQRHEHLRRDEELCTVVLQSEHVDNLVVLRAVAEMARRGAAPARLLHVAQKQLGESLEKHRVGRRALEEMAEPCPPALGPACLLNPAGSGGELCRRGQRLAGGSRSHRRAEGEQPAEEFDEECEDFRVALGWASAKEASAT